MLMSLKLCFISFHPPLKITFQCYLVSEGRIENSLWNNSLIGNFSPLLCSDPEQLKKELHELVSALEEHFFQPQKYNLQPKAE